MKNKNWLLRLDSWLEGNVNARRVLYPLASVITLITLAGFTMLFTNHN